jgi:glucose/mannose-6-phosphate isomerase
MLTPVQVKKYDAENMLHLLSNFAEQCRHAQKIAERLEIRKAEVGKFSHIVIVGMGGSAIGGDFVRAVIGDQSPVPVIVNRNYTLPAFIGPQTLFIAVSYSGNTEETLQSIEAAHERASEIYVITSGGKLKGIAEKRGYPCVVIPSGQQPRASLGYLSIPVLSILSRLGLAPQLNLQADLNETVALLEELAQRFRPEVVDSLPKRIAQRLYGKLPLIYAPQELEAVAIRWKGQFGENSKSLAYCNVYPEMNHNEIEGWRHPPNLTHQCHVLQLRDPAMPAQTRRRMDITAELIAEHTAGVTQVHSQGDSLLARLFSLIAIGDWISFYLAILYEQDPTPVNRIQELKRRLEA